MTATFRPGGFAVHYPPGAGAAARGRPSAEAVEVPLAMGRKVIFLPGRSYPFGIILHLCI
jgi:hypothetical protein